MTLNVEGCEKLSPCEIREFAEFVGERKVAVRHDAKEPSEEILGYKRYIEFLGHEPTLQERLAAEEKAKGEWAEKDGKEGGEEAGSSKNAESTSLSPLKALLKDSIASGSAAAAAAAAPISTI